MSRATPHDPTRIQELMLRAALCGPDQARAAWDEVRLSVPAIEALDRPSRRLAPQVYSNLRRAGVSDPLVTRMADIRRYTAFRNEQLFDEGGAVIARLRSAGIDTLAFKGMPLSMLHHRDTGARPMSDLDLLVRPADAEDAAAVLERAGWLPKNPGHRPMQALRRHSHSYPFRNGRFELDLHWCPLHEPVDTAPFWDAAVPMPIAGVEARALCAADELLVTLAHGLLGESATARWIADGVVVVRSPGDGIDWDRFVHQARACRLTARLEYGLRLLATRFDAAVPRTALEALAASRRPVHERVAHAAVMRGARRGTATAVSWDRYRRLRTLDAQVARMSFPAYLREVVDAPTWRAFARGYGRRAAAHEAQRA